MVSKKTKSLLMALVFILSPCLAAAGDEMQINQELQNNTGGNYTVSPTGANNDQNIINEAISAASESGGGTVYLNAGVYLVDGPIIIKSNIKLTGDPNAIIKVSSTSSQWFTGSTGVISCQESLQNVEICNFQIDGNIDELPKSYSDSMADTDHDCEKLILLGGYSNQFANNIKIHDMKLYNSFSDGIYLRFTNYASCYSNFISNCQHEGIYYSVVLKSVIHGNKIAGITSDCARLDNCVDCKVFDNLFFSYDGDSNGAYKHGENGLQIGDAGASHGYDASNKPTTTTNIEVFNNSFADPGLRAIWLDSTGKGVKNVYVHDNKFIDASGLETMGIPVGDISYDNPPTVEMSEKVFRSIFDILDISFVGTGRTEQKEQDIQFTVKETKQGKIAGGIKIIGFKDLINIDGVPYIPDEKSVLVKYAAVKAPSFDFLGIGTSNISKTVTTKIENGTAKAVLKVKLGYNTIKTDFKTGKTTNKYKTSTAVFNDSCPAPEVLGRPTTKTGYINEYRSKRPNTRVYVDPAGLQKIEFNYAGNTTTHTFFIGERQTNEAGVQYTNYTRVDRWDGDIPNLDNTLIIYGDFNPEKLNVTCYTPYENFTVTDFKTTAHDMKNEVWTGSQAYFILKFLIMAICGYVIIRVIIPE